MHLLAALLNGAQGALDTLKELANAMANDANFAASMKTALAEKASQASLTAYLADYVRKPAWCPSGGAVNAYTFSAMTATALVDGMSVYLDNVTDTNTGASTLNWSGLGWAGR